MLKQDSKVRVRGRSKGQRVKGKGEGKGEGKSEDRHYKNSFHLAEIGTFCKIR